MSERVRALIMAKAPVPGTVKTRLKLAPEKAARLQEALLADTVEKVCAINSLGAVTIAGSPAARLDLLAPFVPDGVALIPQIEGDLGRKMFAGAKTLFEESSDPVLILGTDAPTLPPEYIERASQALRAHDVSIVPSADGGYVLLGLREPHEVLFSGIEWSTGLVYEQTLAVARNASLPVHEEKAWYDVDTPEDLDALKETLARDPQLAPRVACVLENL